jgi:tetratricopeptide (TPR) repeat protein
MVANRSRRLPLLRSVFAAIAIALCAATHAAAQQYLEAFANGIRAIDQQRWAEAARQMQAAATARPDTGDNTRVYGTRFELYVPNYFLGVAQYELQNFQVAVQAFDTAESLGGVKKNGTYYTRLRRLRDESHAKLVAAAPAPAPRSPAPQPSTAAAAPTPAPPPPTPAPASRPSAAPAASIAAAIAAAEQSVQRSTAERDAVNRLPDLAVLRQLDTGLARADAAARANLTEATTKLETGRRGDPADLDKAQTLSRDAFNEFQQVWQIAATVNARVKNELITATTPYFSGEYAAAKTALDRLSYPGGRFGGQLRLFRSASSYALYVLGGQRDQVLRDQAETDARECRRMLGSGFTPDPKAFSPRFIAFFTSRS